MKLHNDHPLGHDGKVIISIYVDRYKTYIKDPEIVNN